MPDRCLTTYIAYVGRLFSLSQEMNDRSKAANLHPSLTGVGRPESVVLGTFTPPGDSNRTRFHRKDRYNIKARCLVAGKGGNFALGSCSSAIANSKAPSVILVLT